MASSPTTTVFPNGIQGNATQSSNVGSLTDSTGGSTSTTLSAVDTTAYTAAELDNIHASLANKINLIEQVLEDNGLTADS